MKRVYLDYAASTPVDKEVEKAMRPFFNIKNNLFANPGSTHWFGQQASAAVFNARQKIAEAIGASYKELVFTASATEGNNLALRGVVLDLVKNLKIKDKSFRIIVSAIEHESVLKTAEDLKNLFEVEVVTIPVNKEGIIDLEKLKNALNKNTVLVSIMLANNEIGTVQPVSEIGKIIKEFRGKNKYPLFHTDAVQAFQFLDCNVDELNVDLMTLSAHKIYGPKGIGLLYVKNINNSSLLTSVITGGGQENGLRSGTENVPYIVGFGKAVELAEKNRIKEYKRLKSLRNYFWKEIRKIIPSVQLNGSLEQRLPNNLNIYFPGRPSQDLSIELDLNGVAISTGVACASRLARPSYVIAALNGGDDRAYSSIRFSFGRYTSKEDINWTLSRLSQRFGK